MVLMRVTAYTSRENRNTKGTKGEPALKPLMLFPRLKTNLFTLKDWVTLGEVGEFM